MENINWNIVGQNKRVVKYKIPIKTLTRKEELEVLRKLNKKYRVKLVDVRKDSKFNIYAYFALIGSIIGLVFYKIFVY